MRLQGARFIAPTHHPGPNTKMEEANKRVIDGHLDMEMHDCTCTIMNSH